ncbi:MAG: endonuclease/exonuclease/phosphatase family protein [Planctomycetota bacterium]
MDSSLLLLGAVFALLVFGRALTDADGSQEESENLNLLSANVRYGTAADGKNSWKQRAELTIKTLVDSEPDILGLQEALDFQVHQVAEAFPDHVVLGEGRDGGDKGEWCALLVDATRFVVRASGTFRLGTKDEIGHVGWDAACTRIATWAELSDRRSTGRSLLVINTHFDHRGAAAREKSAQQLVQWGKERQGARGELAVILLGDLNVEENSPPLETLKAAGLVDTFRALHSEAAETGTFHGFKGGRDGKRIDYCLVGQGWRIEKAWIDWTEEGNRFPSDHRFVGATVRLDG